MLTSSCARQDTLRKAPASSQGAHSLKETAIEQHGHLICTTLIVVIGLLAGSMLSSEAGIPQPWSTISEICGWAYFAAWSLSFYPQLYSNWRRKSVVGLSFDFALVNVLGFGCLAIFYCAFYFNTNVREQYRESHNGSENSVRANDVLFGVHALILTALTAGQIAIYDRGNQRVSGLCKLAISASLLLILVWGVAMGIAPGKVSALSFLYMLSYIKVAVTASKYIPQAVLNFRRKSTVGFNIGQIILDLTGGILSFIQLAMEAIILKDSTLVTGDPVKLCLSLLSIVYDSLIMFQHYVLYRDRTGKHAAAPTPEAEHTDEESLLSERGES